MWIVYALGVLAFFMRRYRFPVAPTVMAVVIGPLLEQEFRRALAISGGDPAVLLSRPISATILFVACVMAVSPWLLRRARRHAG